MKKKLSGNLNTNRKLHFYRNKNDLNNNIIILCNGYSFSTATNGRDRFDSYQLRKKIYIDEFSWANEKKLIETDEFDNFSTHFIIRNPENKAIATFRSTPYDFEWMGTKCYNKIFKDDIGSYKSCGSNEISRLCIDKSYRNKLISDEITVFDFLAMGMLLQSAAENTQTLIFVAHRYLFVLLERKGLKVEMLSQTHKMPDGCKISAGRIDTRQSIDHFTPFLKVDSGTQPLAA